MKRTTITTTPAPTGHPWPRRRSLRHAALALCAALLALVAASCTADQLADTDPDPAADVLTFAVSPRPAFTEAAAVSGQGTASAAAPATRAQLDDDATRWQTGDILWLDVRFYRNKVNSTTHDAICTSALKYDGTDWRYLTETEAENLNAGNIPGFTRLVRRPREAADWVDPGILIYAYYVGSGKPDADGRFTITPMGEIPAMPLITGGYGTCSFDVQPVPLKLGHFSSRVRIPAGCKLELTNTTYWVELGFSLDKGSALEQNWIAEIPEQSADTDVFLSLSGSSTVKLIRGNVSYTFALPQVTDAEGNLTRNDVSYTFPLPTSGTQSLVAGYDLIVATETELRRFAGLVNSGGTMNGKPAAEARVLQTADIELTQGEWTPIGNGSHPFLGAYNGDGHTITGLSIKTTPKNGEGNVIYAGLFGCVGKLIPTDSEQGGVLTGIHLRKVQIDLPAGSGETDLYVGSIAGSILLSTLSLCSAEGTVKASSDAASVSAGGIAGLSWESTISRCRASVETAAASTMPVDGVAYAGEIAGQNFMYSFILSCEARGGAVTAEASRSAGAGGITGINVQAALIAFCRTGENVVTARNGTDANCAGGVVGSNNGGYLYSCYSRATAEATGSTVNRAGAIAGDNSKQDRVQYCYATGATGQGTSRLASDPGSIVYNTSPASGEIVGVMTGYTDEVKSVDNFGGSPHYPYTTRYDPSATPAYGIIPRRAVWKSSGAWKAGYGTYPELNIEEYEGE